MNELSGKTVYLSGAIASDPDFKTKFKRYEDHCYSQGAKRVMNPATLPPGYSYLEYMQFCMLMVTWAEVMVLIPDWGRSPGARTERAYAEALKKLIVELPKE